MQRHVKLPASFPFPYIDYNARVGVCWLRLYRSVDDQRFIAVTTDLACRLHSAATLTNAVELVATEIAARFDYMPWEFQVIEHYDWRGTASAAARGDLAEHFHLVEFEWDEKQKEFHAPRWKMIAKEAVARQIHGTLHDERLECILRANWEGVPSDPVPVESGRCG